MKYRYVDEYAVLMYVGEAEYWIGFGGHAHSQAVTGLPAGTLGKLDGRDYGAV